MGDLGRADLWWHARGRALCGESLARTVSPAALPRKCDGVESDPECLSPTHGRRCVAGHAAFPPLRDLWRGSFGDGFFGTVVHEAWRKHAATGEHVWDHRDDGSCHSSTAVRE